MGLDRGGGAPHPLSRFPPLQRPITRQAPAPGAASRGPATPKRRVFAGKKIRAAGNAAGRGGRPGAPGYRRVGAGSGATHASPSPSSAGPGAQAGERSGAPGEVRLRADRGAIPGRGQGPGAPGAETLGNFPEPPGDARRARAHACPAAWLFRTPSRALPRPRRPSGTVLSSPGAGRGEGNIPRAPRGSRPLGGGGPGEPQGRMSGSAPARGAPRDSIVAPEPDFARP